MNKLNNIDMLEVFTIIYYDFSLINILSLIQPQRGGEPYKKKKNSSPIGLA